MGRGKSTILLLLLLLLLLYECETRGMREGDKCIVYKISGGEPEGLRPLKKSRCRREGVIWIQLFQGLI